MEYIASLSYGKDSIAMLEVIAEHKFSLDRIAHVEIMATSGVPADLPEVVQWKQYADEVIYKRYGIRVEHIRAEKSFEDLFYRIPQRRSYNAEKQGTIRGFPSLSCPWCSKELKVEVMHKTYRGSVQYIGIAADEPERHSQLTETVRSPLVELNVTERECMEICKKINLLAPTYLQSKRSGCWFCPFQPLEQLRLLRRQHPELWNMLLKWDIDSTVPFRRRDKYHITTVTDLDKRFALEDEGTIPKRCSGFSDFGLQVKAQLESRGKEQKWLVEEIKIKTGLFADNGYLYKIFTGRRNAPKVVQAIREILDIPMLEETAY